MQFKTKKSYKFAENKIDISVFEGVPPKAFSKPKNQEDQVKEDYEKR